MRRAEISGHLLLSAVWAWLVIVVGCGAMSSRMERMAAMEMPTECCAHVPVNDPCDSSPSSPACVFACVSIFTVALSENRIELLPEVTAQRFGFINETADALSRRPPVPPPKMAV